MTQKFICDLSDYKHPRLEKVAIALSVGGHYHPFVLMAYQFSMAAIRWKSREDTRILNTEQRTIIMRKLVFAAKMSVTFIITHGGDITMINLPLFVSDSDFGLKKANVRAFRCYNIQTRTR